MSGIKKLYTSFANIFKGNEKKNLSKPRAVAFVDYEHWYYSYCNLYHLKPNPASWREELEEQYELVDLYFFADFSSSNIKFEIPKIRQVTNHIIETQNPGPYRKKDMTDFIMLDFIYQRIIDRDDADVYILFTGDGHFQSVTKYLIQQKNKQAVVYGVKDAISKQLKAVVSICVEMPTSGALMMSYYQMIIDNFGYIADNPNKRIIPTFRNSIEIIARNNDVPQDAIQAALSKMISEGYIYQKQYRVEFSKQIKILAANWDLLRKDGLWSPEPTHAL